MIRPTDDFCTFCGWRGTWTQVEGLSVRESFRCGECRASLRYRNQAAAILRIFGRGRYVTLRDLVRAPHMQEVSIFETALHGPFVKLFSALPGYQRSYFWEDVPLGSEKNGVRSEDLTQLTFPDNQFDLITSSDVMEHVFGFETALKEIYRVLKPGGYNVFTIPFSWPIPDTTVKRAELVGGEIVHHVPPHYHRAGDGGPSLVCTDYGLDLIELLEGIGYETYLERPSNSRFPLYFDALVVARRPR